MDANFKYNLNSTLPSFQPSDPALVGCIPNPLMTRIPPPTSRLNTPPPLIPFHPQMSTQPSAYRCSYLLSDGSQHRGEGRNLSAAKVDAALNVSYKLYLKNQTCFYRLCSIYALSSSKWKLN